MNEPIDVHGMWWLPETPEHKVPGWLRYDLENGGELRLSGSLRPPQWVVSRRGKQVVQRTIAEPSADKRIYPRIHGQSGRKLFHLEDSFQVKIECYLCREEDAAEKIHVNWLLTGAWFDGDEQVEFDKATVRFQRLTDWVDHSGLETDSFERDADAPFAGARANVVPPFRTQVAADCELILWQELSTGGDGRNELTLNQVWTLSVSAGATQPLELYTDCVSDFQDLLTIATGKVANVETFHFTHNDVPMMSLGGTPIGNMKERLGYYSRWSNRDDHEDRLSPALMLFTFDDLGGIEGVEVDAVRRFLSLGTLTRHGDSL